MFKFTKTDIKIKRLILFSIIFFLFFISMYLYSKTDFEEINKNIQNENIMQQNQNIISEESILSKQKSQEENNIWQIEIEKISLKAKIAEGTSKEILNKYIGHFEETQKEKGNIGLAAHNRGYDVNYFKDLKLLKEGDEIKYKHNQYENTYEVTKNIIIKDTDWQYLENTEDNTLTLITCVENEPDYRRCVQAVEKEESEEMY